VTPQSLAQGTRRLPAGAADALITTAAVVDRAGCFSSLP